MIAQAPQVPVVTYDPASAAMYLSLISMRLRMVRGVSKDGVYGVINAALYGWCRSYNRIGAARCCTNRCVHVWYLR